MRSHRERVCTAVAHDGVSLQYATPETRDFLATDLVVQRDRRIAELEKIIKVYEHRQLAKWYIVVMKHVTKHSDMMIICATLRHIIVSGK